MPHPLEGILGLQWSKKLIQPTNPLGYFGYAKYPKNRFKPPVLKKRLPFCLAKRQLFWVSNIRQNSGEIRKETEALTKKKDYYTLGTF